jgi:hypothetical protein
MIAKFIPVSVALVTAIAGSAAAHETGHDNRAGYPAGRYPAGQGADHSAPAVQPGYRADGPGYRADARRTEERNELRQSDLNRDGRVTLAEALQQGRRGFRHDDRDQNRALSPREVSWGDVAHEDRDRNGWISYGEYQDAIRRSFARFDSNRDGVLASYELRQFNGPRAAGWRR